MDTLRAGHGQQLSAPILLFSRLHAVDGTDQSLDGCRDDIRVHAGAPGDVAVFIRDADVGHRAAVLADFQRVLAVRQILVGDVEVLSLIHI